MRITLPSGTAAELATPSGGAPVQGLVVIPDIMGLRPLFDDLAARLADQYDLVVCVPEPFPGVEDQPLNWRMEHAGEVADERRLGDLVAAADATGMEAVGIIGFCMGGMYALKAAGSGRFTRAVAFYGMVRTPDNWKSDGNVEPLDAVVAEGACPVLHIAGSEDQWTPAEDLRALSEVGGTVIVYEDADHGFVHDPSRPTHRADDAADAWRNAMAFLNGEALDA
jgi:carboxymethylenebutenolidase